MAAEAAGEPAGAPKMEMVPASGETRPTMERMRVLLPAPLGPRRPRHSPERSSSEMLSTAVMEPKRLTRPVTSSGAGLGGGTGLALAAMGGLLRFGALGQSYSKGRAGVLYAG